MSSAASNLAVLSVVASAVLSPMRAVTVAGAIPAAGANTLGVALQAGPIGIATPIVVLGTALCEAGAAVAAGVLLEVNSTGQFIPRTSGAIVGRALTAAASIGDQFEAFLIPN
jgi:hypothetical protein